MAYVRKTQNDAELSAACRRASLSRKEFRGGRPTADGGPRRKMHTLTIWDEDYAKVRDVAAGAGETIVKMFHLLVERYLLADSSMKQRGVKWPDERADAT